MAFGWIKHALPRGLYGRAALILVVPVVGLQLVVSAAFLQRHFEGVTEQMTRSIALDLTLLHDRLEEGGIPAAQPIAGPLEFDLAPGTQPDWTATQDSRRLFYDLSGRVVMRTLREMVPGVTWIDIYENDRVVKFNLALGSGDSVDVTFSRRRVSASNPHQLLVLMVASGMLMTAIAYIFLRNQLRPIRRLARAAEAFGKGQRVEYRPRGALEVRAAGRAFLDMRSRIEQQMRERTMMLSGVSHDLRTPLTRMRLALSMAEGEEAEALERDVEEMEGLIGTFLDFARGEALDDPVPSDPVEIATRAVENARRAGGEVELVADAQGQIVPLRPAAVGRALANLLSNALRYGSRARVSVHVLERAVRFTVEDDGPGIPASERARALEPFSRLDDARNQDRGLGVGLGLAIASDVARGHGGTLRLSDSADLGGLRADLVIAR
ncbi:HAMP domain-containing protein [Rhodobacterales bacterium HKCCE3408]|nr:HAMP domain-containing protein [Rhodobacterales bacterium HKCCE3408]